MCQQRFGCETVSGADIAVRQPLPVGSQAAGLDPCPEAETEYEGVCLESEMYSAIAVTEGTVWKARTIVQPYMLVCLCIRVF